MISLRPTFLLIGEGHAVARIQCKKDIGVGPTQFTGCGLK